jgi:hypothetical protein
MKQTFLVLSVLLSVSGVARAQEAGQVGVTLGYPAEVGIIWHVTDRVAVRPDISFSTGSTDTGTLGSDISFFGESSGFGESSSTTLTVGVSALLYLGEWDKLRAYVSPRYAYGRNWSSSGTTFGIDNKHSTYTVAGSFGAQYQLHRRFAVFGETGFGYNHARSTLTSSVFVLPAIQLLPNVPAPVSRSTEINSHVWGTRSGAGVIFYFK